MSEKEITAEYNQLRGFRENLEIKLEETINNFAAVRIRYLGKNKSQKAEPSERDFSHTVEKENLRQKVLFFSLLHDYYESKLRQKPRFGGISQKTKGEYKNETNIMRARIQQYAAMRIINNPEKNLPVFLNMLKEVDEAYSLSPNEKEAMIKGIFGFVAAYHYYGDRGYKVLFAHPKVDANQATDMFLLPREEITSKWVDVLSEKKVLNVDDTLPSWMREKMWKVQVKCANKKETSPEEWIYDLKTDSVYKGEENYKKGIPQYSMAEVDDSRFAGDDEETEAYWFFKSHCQKTTNGRYVKFNINDESMKDYGIIFGDKKIKEK